MKKWAKGNRKYSAMEMRIEFRVSAFERKDVEKNWEVLAFEEIKRKEIAEND